MNIDLVQIFWLQIVIFATSPDIALSKWTIKIKVFIPKNVALSIKVDQRPNSNVKFSLLEQQRFFNVFLNHKAKTFEFSNGLFFMLMRCLFFLFTLIDSLRQLNIALYDLVNSSEGVNLLKDRVWLKVQNECEWDKVIDIHCAFFTVLS